MKCMYSDHAAVDDDGKINKTALASFFGPVGDPQIVENIAECEAIGKTSNFDDQVLEYLEFQLQSGRSMTILTVLFRIMS